MLKGSAQPTRSATIAVRRSMACLQREPIALSEPNGAHHSKHRSSEMRGRPASATPHTRLTNPIKITSTATAPQGGSSPSPLLGRGFYLLRLHRSFGGSWLSFCEIVNHDQGHTWALIQGRYNQEDGLELSVLASSTLCRK